MYDPLYTLKTTLAGQLSLCMLSEKLMINCEDITFLQINTDGLTVIIPKKDKRKFYNLCLEWEKETNLGLEYVSYDKMIIRDVNNYLSVGHDGKIKRKGAFVTYQQMLKEESYHKSLSQAIVPYAIEKYFLENIPVEETIMKHTDIYDFCKVFNASHGWKCFINGEQQQKTNRYYISTNGGTFVKTKDDKSIEIEAGGKLVTIFNNFVDKPMDEYDIDYDYYINECYKIIHKIDGTEDRLLEEARLAKEIEKMNKEEENFLKFCVNKIPTKLQYEKHKRDWLIEKYGEPEKIK